MTALRACVFAGPLVWQKVSEIKRTWIPSPSCVLQSIWIGTNYLVQASVRTSIKWHAWWNVLNALPNCSRKVRKASPGDFQHHGLLMDSDLGQEQYTSSMCHPDLPPVQNRSPYPGTAPHRAWDFLKNQMVPKWKMLTLPVVLVFLPLLSVFKPLLKTNLLSQPAFLFWFSRQSWCSNSGQFCFQLAHLSPLTRSALEAHIYLLCPKPHDFSMPRIL